jgi:hypothetical protein
MKILIAFVLSFFLSFIGIGEKAFAGGGHVGVGGDGYMISSLPTDNHLYKMYNIYYNSSKVKDNNGKSIPGNTRVESFTQMHRFLFQTGLKIFGADWMINIAVPISWTHMSRDLTATGEAMSMFGLGDIPVSPFLLGWHGDRWDLLADVLIFLPTGRFSEHNPASPGQGYTSIIPAIGGTYFFDAEKTFSVSTMIRYEFNTSQRHTHIRHGNNVHFEMAIGKSFNGLVDLALVAGGSWQVTDSKGTGLQNTMYRHKHVIGPEIGLNVLGMNFNLRHLFEFKNRNTTEGTMTVFSLVKFF